MNPEDEIKITYYNSVTEGKTIAIFGCHCIKDDFYMSGLSWVKSDNGGHFIGWPSKEFMNPKTGKREFSNCCWYGKEKMKWFQETVQKSLKSYAQKKGIALPFLSISEQKPDPAPAPEPQAADPYWNQTECPF